MKKRLLALFLALIALFSFAFAEVLVDYDEGVAIDEEYIVEYGEYYYSKDEVSLYLYAFGLLPENFITKDEAYDLGWSSKKGNLWDVAYGFCIGGDVFGNREGNLPKAKGRTWYECDIDYEGGYRNDRRIVFSSDGLIYYSDDHYSTFTLLYDGWYLQDYIYGIEEEAR